MENPLQDLNEFLARLHGDLAANQLMQPRNKAANTPADPVFGAFLANQHAALMELAAQSDLFSVEPIRDTDESDTPPSAYVITFHCKGLVMNREGNVEEADSFKVGIRFEDEYLRGDTTGAVRWLGPFHAYNPQINGPFICLGKISPNTGIVDLIYRIYDVLRFANVAPHDALNPEAAAWARNHMERFPVDARPLLRRRGRTQVLESTRNPQAEN